MSLSPALTEAAEALLAACRRQGVMLATAESCTGGLVAAALTAIPGSSRVVERGFVTYSNDAKTELLGVPAALIAAEGAVSAPVAIAMAEGAISHARAAASLSITGIAGPDGGSLTKPVGLVHIAAARQGFATWQQQHLLAGDRDAVREQAALAAMRLLTARVLSDQAI